VEFKVVNESIFSKPAPEQRHTIMDKSAHSSSTITNEYICDVDDIPKDKITLYIPLMHLVVMPTGLRIDVPEE
jgi:hypothetical protein